MVLFDNRCCFYLLTYLLPPPLKALDSERVLIYGLFTFEQS